MMKIEMKDEWVLCPVCKSKTRVNIKCQDQMHKKYYIKMYNYSVCFK